MRTTPVKCIMWWCKASRDPVLTSISKRGFRGVNEVVFLCQGGWAKHRLTCLHSLALTADTSLEPQVALGTRSLQMAMPMDACIELTGLAPTVSARGGI